MRTQKTQPAPKCKEEPLPLAYCVEDIAKIIGIGRTSVFKLIKENKLSALKIGRRTLVTRLAVEAFLADSVDAE